MVSLIHRAGIFSGTVWISAAKIAWKLFPNVYTCGLALTAQSRHSQDVQDNVVVSHQRCAWPKTMPFEIHGQIGREHGKSFSWKTSTIVSCVYIHFLTISVPVIMENERFVAFV